MWQLAITDLAQRLRGLVDDYDSFVITPRLNGYRDIAINGARGSALVGLEPGQHAVKAYRDGTLRFHGKVWEPLARKPVAVGSTIIARDPLAELVERRTRIKTVYTATDAGLIAQDRLTVQNGYRSTYMRNGSRQASSTRDRTYLVSVREGDILDELATAAGGFFYRADPLDGVAGYMAELVITYPDARTTREEARFAFGEKTADNLVTYEHVQALPRNRYLTASADAAGNRLTGVAEDLTSQATYGLFEGVDDFSDVTDVNLLTQQAQAQIAPEPQVTLALTPGPDAPLLFTDFNVGDFVRLRILDPDAGLDFFDWVRVTEAGLTVDRDGREWTSAISVEMLQGAGSTLLNPAQRWRARFDDLERLLEALGRRVGGFAPPAVGGGGGGGGEEPPPEPAPDPEPPPPPPPPPPIAELVVAKSSWWSYRGLPVPPAPQLELGGRVNPNGETTEIWFEYREGVDFGVTSIVPVKSTPHYDIGDGIAPVDVGQYVFNVNRATTYYVRLRASSAAGTAASSSAPTTTPANPVSVVQ